MEHVLQTHELTKTYGQRTVLDKVNMNIQKGDIYGFIGRNGAGKTTLMRTVLGLTNASSGSFELFGSKDTVKARKKIGALIETPGLYRNCTALENLKRFGLLYNAKNKNYKEMLDFVGLGETGNKKAGQFSLGMRQRLGIAIAMLDEPEFMVLDEPVNGLDPTGMKEVRDVILNLNKERGITVLISSHLLEELSKTVTKYGIINQGQLVEEITVDELEAKCSKKLLIGVDNVTKAIELLSKEVPENAMTVKDSVIALEERIEEGAFFNKLLVNEDINVHKLVLQTDNLEDYFLQRIGGR